MVLRFDLNGRPFPAPLIDAVLGGQPTTLIVDTGATHHVVAAWLADELSLPRISAGDVGVDHAGQRVPVSRIEGAGVALAGWGPVDAPSLLVIDVPDPLRRSGLGGFLSPQALASGGRAIVLDLRDGSDTGRDSAFAGPSMTEASFEDAARALPPPIADLGVCGGPSEGSEITARATIDGIPVVLKVDTGATESSVLADSAPGKRFAGRAKGARSAYAASGKHTVPVLEGARITFGGAEVSADLDFVPGRPRSSCPTDGFLGMDVLRRCVLLLGEARAVARCNP